MAEQLHWNERTGEMELRSPTPAAPRAKRGRSVRVAGGGTLVLPLAEPPAVPPAPSAPLDAPDPPAAPRRRRTVRGTEFDYHERCAQLLGWSVADVQACSIASLIEAVREKLPKLAKELERIRDTRVYLIGEHLKTGGDTLTDREASAMLAQLAAKRAPSAPPVTALYAPGVGKVLRAALARLSPPGAWHWIDPSLPPTVEVVFGHRADGSLLRTPEACAEGVAWNIDGALWLGANDEALYAASIPPINDELTARYPAPRGYRYRDRFVWEEHPSRTQAEVVAVVVGALARAEADHGR